MPLVVHRHLLNVVTVNRVLAANVVVESGGSFHFDGYLQACPSTGCVPVPEFGSQTVAIIVMTTVGITTILMSRT